MDVILAVATLLGGLSALWYFGEKFQERRRARVAPPSIRDADPPTEVLPPSQETATPPPGSRPALPNSPVGAPDAPVTDPALPLEAVLAAIDSDTGTGLQRAQFVRRNSGRRVIWTGELKAVEPAIGHGNDAPLIMVLAPILSEKKFPPLATAAFPASEGDVLGGLNSGDLVVVEGILAFSDLGGRWSASLREAHFIRRASHAGV